MTMPLTPNAIVHQLVELGQELDTTVRMMKQVEVEAAEKRHAADMAESRAFVSAEGSMDLRKHTARLAADRIEGEALVAEALARHLRAQIRALGERIEIGRSLGAALRAELAVMPYDPSA
jgi:hypothetical protein